MERFGLRRKSKVERLRDAVQELPPAGRIGLIAVATGLLVGLAYLTRKRLFVAAAVVADVVEEAADTVEDSCGGSRRGRPRGRRRLGTLERGRPQADLASRIPCAQSVGGGGPDRCDLLARASGRYLATGLHGPRSCPSGRRARCGSPRTVKAGLCTRFRTALPSYGAIARCCEGAESADASEGPSCCSGSCSLLTDISSEMVATILPLYLLYTVGSQPLAVRRRRRHLPGAAPPSCGSPAASSGTAGGGTRRLPRSATGSPRSASSP